MTKLVSKNPMVYKIVDGEVSTEIYDLLFSKQLPLTEEEYLEILVFLLKKDDLKPKALSILKTIPEFVKPQYVEKKDANHRVAYYILYEALSQGNSNIVTKIIVNQAFPVEFLLKIAETGNTSMLELLLENQIKLIAYPQILDKMEQNHSISNFIKGKIGELRDFYLKEEKAAEIAQEDVIENIQELVKKEDQSSEDESDEISFEEIQEKVVTTLQRINELSVPERIKLALIGTRTERMILIKDSNKLVAIAVLESPKLTEDEVVLMLRDRSIAQEIISKIANNRKWSKNYNLVLEMVQNPKAPLKKALGLVKKLHIKDLKCLIHDKNVHYVVRNLATNLLNEKTSNR
ncbi:MAG: hypothetical protein KAT17_00005 [Candidatus Aminicenantes bacterium]|nr:hypothetical protein [Candidatus Aminicenantes bacterium]